MFFDYAFCVLLGAAVSVFSTYFGMKIREKKMPPPFTLKEDESRQEAKIEEQWVKMLNYSGEVRSDG